MSKLVLFNKPYGILSQFSGEVPAHTLSHFIGLKDVYPAGRLDKDSEGLLLLTDDGRLQHTISHPANKMEKTYWAQVEGIIDDAALRKLSQGIPLKDGKTRPARARLISAPDVWQRHPPIRFRKNVATSWVELTISEGKNRQVRRMTAATGFPTLRLIRIRIGDWQLGTLQSGQWRELDIDPPSAPPLKRNSRNAPPARAAAQDRGNFRKGPGGSSAKRTAGKRRISKKT